eukprot:m.4131 g.4131  ORF g.4131 m.4131 type:complete len:77 (+) comp6723_c0_seq1:2400-2630(+)
MRLSFLDVSHVNCYRLQRHTLKVVVTHLDLIPCCFTCNKMLRMRDTSFSLRLDFTLKSTWNATRSHSLPGAALSRC